MDVPEYVEAKKVATSEVTKTQIVLIPTFLLITVPIRMLTRKTNGVIPLPFFLYAVASLLGVIAAAVWGVPTTKNYTVNPHTLLNLFVPLYIFSTLYTIDYFTLKMCRAQIVIMSLMGVSINAVMLAVLFKATLHPSWSYSMTLLGVLACIPIKTKYIIDVFNELAKYKYLATIVEGESLMTSVLVLLCYHLTARFYNGIIEDAGDMMLVLIYKASVGCTFGFLVGKLTSLLMYVFYNEPTIIVTSAISLVYITFYISHYLLVASGELSVLWLSYFMAINRHKLTTETDTNLERIANVLFYIVTYSSLAFATVEITQFLWLHVQSNHIFGILLTYFSATISRVMSFIIMGLLLNRFTYEINMKCLLILGWGGVKGALNFILMLLLLTNEDTMDMANDFVMEITFYMGLSLLINGSTMRLALQLIGLTHTKNSYTPSFSKWMQVIMERRNVITRLLKYNRNLSNTNWSFVRELTSINPLKLKITEKSDVEDDVIFGMNICPDCFKEIEFDLTPEELEEQLNSARIEILKAKKALIVKQYETGIINKSCFQVLKHSIDLILELNVKCEVVDLKKFLKKQKWLITAKIIVKFLIKPKNLVLPSSPFKRVFFYIMHHVSYDYVLCGFIVLDFCLAIVDTLLNNLHVSYEPIFLAIFFTGNVISMLAFPFQRKSKNCANYFRFPWTAFDFIIVIARIICLTMTFAFNLTPVYHLAISVVHLMRIFCLLEYLSMKLVAWLDYREDMRRCFGFDLATILVNCCDEVLENISDLIEIKCVRDIQVKKLLEEKGLLMKEIERVQKERPWVATTVKTKQAIRSTLTAMQETLTELNASGFVDDDEFRMINKDLWSKQKLLRNMTFVESSSPVSLFREVHWMGNDQTVIDFLFKNAVVVNWKTGDIIVKEDKLSGGVYIVISGLLQLKYEPRDATLDRHHKFGNIPIVDFLSTLEFNESIHDTIVPGNSFGELSVLTERPYDCSIVAEAEGEAYFLKHSVLKSAMRLSTEKSNSLESRIWKFSTLNLIVAILMESPAYQSLTQEQFNHKLDKGFMPNLRCYKMFVINEHIEDVVLVEGIAADFTNSQIYRAPVTLPKTVQRIVLPRSSYLALGEIVQTKLFVIPFGKYTEYEVMEREAEIGELESIKIIDCAEHSVTSIHGNNDKI